MTVSASTVPTGADVVGSTHEANWFCLVRNDACRYMGNPIHTVAEHGSYAAYVGSLKTYTSKTSGTCTDFALSLAECNVAAAALGAGLGKVDLAAADDALNANGAKPKGCYYDGADLKYNAAASNTGSCSGSYTCLCKDGTASLCEDSKASSAACHSRVVVSRAATATAARRRLAASASSASTARRRLAVSSNQAIVVQLVPSSGQSTASLVTAARPRPPPPGPVDTPPRGTLPCQHTAVTLSHASTWHSLMPPRGTPMPPRVTL